MSKEENHYKAFYCENCGYSLSAEGRIQSKESLTVYHWCDGFEYLTVDYELRIEPSECGEFTCEECGNLVTLETFEGTQNCPHLWWVFGSTGHRCCHICGLSERGEIEVKFKSDK